MSITGECNVTPLTPKLPHADKGVYCSLVFFAHEHLTSRNSCCKLYHSLPW